MNVFAIVRSRARYAQAFSSRNPMQQSQLMNQRFCYLPGVDELATRARGGEYVNEVEVRSK
jgi:hypothetical protein